MKLLITQMWMEHRLSALLQLHLHSRLSFNGLGKGNCKTRRESFKFWDLVWLILEVLLYIDIFYKFLTLRCYREYFLMEDRDLFITVNSLPQLPMPWLHESPGHQQPWQQPISGRFYWNLKCVTSKQIMPDSKVYGANMGPGTDRTQLGPMWATLSWLSGLLIIWTLSVKLPKISLLIRQH